MTRQIVSQSGNNDKNDAKSSEKKSSINTDITVEAAIALAKDNTDTLLNPTGNLVQNLLVEESASAVHANMKDALREVVINNPECLRASLPFWILNP